MKNAAQRGFKGLILKGCPFLRPLHTVAGSPVLPGLMAEEQQGVYVVGGVFPAVLMQHPAAFGKTHGSKSVILRDGQIAIFHSVDQCIINAVSALVEYKGMGTLPVEFVGRIAEQTTGDMKFSENPECYVCHRAAVGIDPKLDGAHLRLTLYHIKNRLQTIFRRNAMKHYEFFQNRECEYFPCHEGITEDAFNCLFCYCPLYALSENCGGAFSYTEDGIKDCSACLRPHLRENYGDIQSMLHMVLKLVKKNDKSGEKP